MIPNDPKALEYLVDIALYYIDPRDEFSRFEGSFSLTEFYQDMAGTPLEAYLDLSDYIIVLQGLANTGAINIYEDTYAPTYFEISSTYVEVLNTRASDPHTHKQMSEIWA